MDDTIIEVSATDQLKALREQKVTTVEMRDCLIRLYRNPDFKKVILNEYLVMEVARFMETAGSPVLGAPQRADALAAAYAPGHLKRWMDARLQMGDHAEQQISQIDEQMLELEHEEMEEHISGETSVDMEYIGSDDDEDDGV